MDKEKYRVVKVGPKEQCPEAGKSPYRVLFEMFIDFKLKEVEWTHQGKEDSKKAGAQSTVSFLLDTIKGKAK